MYAGASEGRGRERVTAHEDDRGGSGSRHVERVGIGRHEHEVRQRNGGAGGADNPHVAGDVVQNVGTGQDTGASDGQPWRDKRPTGSRTGAGVNPVDSDTDIGRENHPATRHRQTANSRNQAQPPAKKEPGGVRGSLKVVHGSVS